MMDGAELDAAFRVAYDRVRATSAAMGTASLAERFAALPRADRERILAGLSTVDRARLLYAWRFWARPKQIAPPGDWRIWLSLGGRGVGKSRTGSEWIRERLAAGARSIALIGPTLRDIERYMLGGRAGKKRNGSGLLDVFPPGQRPVWHQTKAEVTFPQYPDAVAYLVTAEEPEFRGANLDTVWCDELAKWKYLRIIWDNMEMALRVKGDIAPQIFVSTTPRPLRLLKELVLDPETVTTQATTAENATNLDPRYLARMARRYEGTRLGRQETGGEILTDNPDALFSSTQWEATRVHDIPSGLVEVAVAVDPAIATKDNNDPTAVVCGGIDRAGIVYVWAAVAERDPPDVWGERAVAMYELHRANVVVAERNRGGDLVAANVRAAYTRRRGYSGTLKCVDVHATRGKEIRAEPVSAMHEQGRVRLVGRLPDLERETTEWNPRLGGRSPNLLDALVWLVWYLARLEDRKPDRRDDMAGIAAVTQAVAEHARPAVSLPSGLAAALPRGEWGSRI